MTIQNTQQGYGIVAILLHWGMAGLIIVLVVMGLYMVSLPDAGFETRKITLILYHKELGVLAFALAVARLGWRLGNVLPRLVDRLPDWQKVVARFVHLSFYGLMFALPITGWIMSSSAGLTVSVFDWIDLPDLVSRDDDLFGLFIGVHKWLGYALIGLMLVHIGAALRHHFFLRDETLKKMLPAPGFPD